MVNDFVEGVKEGVKRYAWMRDGVFYVGDGHHTLKEALDKVDREFADLPLGVQRRKVTPVPPNTPTNQGHWEWA